MIGLIRKIALIPNECQRIDKNFCVFHCIMGILYKHIRKVKRKFVIQVPESWVIPHYCAKG